MTAPNPICRVYANGIQEHVYPPGSTNGTHCYCRDRQLGLLKAKEKVQS